MMLLLRRKLLDLDKMWYLNAEQRVDYDNVVEIETSSKITIWRTFVFLNRKKLHSHRLRYIDEIWFSDSFWHFDNSEVNKYKTGSSTEPSRLPSWKSIWHDYSAADARIWIKFCSAQSETGSKIAPQRLPSWKSLRRHNTGKDSLDEARCSTACRLRNRKDYCNMVDIEQAVLLLGGHRQYQCLWQLRTLFWYIQ